MASEAHSNRLSGETSAYLRSAAHQPVDWYPWSEEAFQRARDLNRPILLDIGAVWCHWCHVMDRESYESEDVARIINERFVAVKVDRDERPDVDRRYQEAVGAITGQGGWPLTGFLTPEGRVFYGGTYFPPDDRYGRPGFASALTQIADFYANRRDEAVRSADSLFEQIRGHISADPGDLSDGLLEDAVDSMGRAFDRRNGGFGMAPKFPHAAAMEFLLRQYAREPETWLRTMFDTTLERMGKGGIRDQIGGGFHRYSVDERWVVPHFEKMLHDNAELLRNYANAFSLTNDPLYREVAESIVYWADSVASHRDVGGFCSSQDADIDLHDDGDYFTWTVDEARSALTEEEYQVLSLYFHIRPQGEMQHNPAKNVLYVDAEPGEIASRLGLTEARVRDLIAVGKSKLYKARLLRTAPFVDPTVYVGWNGMMISAYLRAGTVLDHPDCCEFALKTLRRVLDDAYIPGKGLAHVCPRAADDGAILLDDQVHIARALVEAYEVTADPTWLTHAEQLVETIIQRFWDPKEHGFFDRALDAGGSSVLQTWHKPLQDSPTASGNGVAATTLCHLYQMTGKQRYQELAQDTLRAFAGAAPGLGYFAGAYFCALDEALHPASHVVVVGSAGDPATESLFAMALRTCRPATIVQRLDPEQSERAGVPDAVRGMLESYQHDKSARAYVCAGNTCAAPVRDPARLADTIRSLRQNA